MTIDKAIEIINHYLDYPKEEVRKALLVAIDTMRKYQKIEDVVADFNNQYNHRTALDLMCEVKEVVEDGNDN